MVPWPLLGQQPSGLVFCCFAFAAAVLFTFRVLLTFVVPITFVMFIAMSVMRSLHGLQVMTLSGGVERRVWVANPSQVLGPRLDIELFQDAVSTRILSLLVND